MDEGIHPAVHDKAADKALLVLYEPPKGEGIGAPGNGCLGIRSEGQRKAKAATGACGKMAEGSFISFPERHYLFHQRTDRSEDGGLAAVLEQNQTGVPLGGGTRQGLHGEERAGGQAMLHERQALEHLSGCFEKRNITHSYTDQEDDSHRY